jgi:putative heme-binding domain-containing protein
MNLPPKTWSHALALLVFGSVAYVAFADDNGAVLELHTRSRQASPGATNQFRIVEKTVRWDARKTVVIICDMWDQHWCRGATARVAEMAPRMNEVVKEARRRGALIIHAPSDTMKFYADWPQRKRAQQAPKATPPADISKWHALNNAKEPPLPIDDSDGGCDDWPRCPDGSPWKHEISTIEIAPEDAISDKGDEVYNLLQQSGRDNVIIMGVHENMCVLGRPFSIRQMVTIGKNVLLMRDMTDTMYNSRRPPYVSHFVGTDLVAEHIEKYWCATVTSADLLGGQPFHFQADKRPRVVFIVGEPEYHTAETLPEFAQTELGKRGVKWDFVNAPVEGGNEFTNWQAIAQADLLFISVRRRTPVQPMIEAIHKHLDAGKPLVGIRTASHAFAAKPPDGAHGAWDSFDRDVLGAHYENHFANELGPKVQVVPEAAAHPILTGFPSDGFASAHSLYRSRNLAPTTRTLLTGTIHVQGVETTEPVAWVNTNDQRRVFYTSLGGPEDFKQPAFRRLLLNAVLWSLRQPLAPADVPTRQNAALPQERPLSPAESQARFKVFDDFEIEQVLAEPIVRQPVSLSFDERGRLWVVQYIQYPDPAGLKMMSRDDVWRAVYDKVPPPPPHHFRGEDKITIHEDTDGDGVFDTHTTFVEGLNIVTSVARGRGGVWVMNPPYLLFYPDRNNDDVPDGDPEVRLSGFGLEDTHSVANSLTWGPDGWLYGCQGSTVTGNIIVYGADGPSLNSKPIYSQGQNIWRYHPEQRRYEIFAEGGGNAFGLEMDAQGRVFSGHNGGNTRGFHYVQGGYLQKGFEKHGPLSNPYAFGYFLPMPHNQAERFTHTFVLYDGGSFPATYDGKLFGVEPLQGRVVLSDIQPDHSSFRTHDLGYPVVTTDQWFRPVDIKLGPDGALYIADWYDRQVNHYRNHEGQIDKSNGRVYRLKAKGAKPVQAFDLAKASDTELLNLLHHRNKWYRQQALRLLADRKNPALVHELNHLVKNSTGQLALEALWALNLSGGFQDDVALELLDHPDPQVRLWAIRLIGDRTTQDLWGELSGKLTQMARTEPDIEVRSQLACTAKRLPAGNALSIVRNLLLRDEDAGDPRLPLLIWWAIEAKAESDRETILALFGDPSLWSRPMVQNQILERLMRRYASAGSREDYLTCTRMLRLALGPAEAAKLMHGLELAFQGRSLAGVPDELLEAMSKAGGESLVLAVRRGDPEAVHKALGIVTDPAAGTQKRLEYIRVLGEVPQPETVPVLLKLLRPGEDKLVCHAALNALQRYEDPAIGQAVAQAATLLTGDTQTAAVALLAMRPTWAAALLEAVDQGKLDRAAVAQDALRRIKLYQDTRVVELYQKHWGHDHAPTTAEMEAKIHQLAGALRNGSGNPYEGQKVFTVSCAVCHRLFGQGGQVGPDLTTYKRDDIDSLLLNVINPSAEIREGYENYLVTTKDGRSLSGFLADKDARVVVLRGLDGENNVVARADITEMKTSGMSLMPEGLLDALNQQQVRDLFAYLRSTQPLVH